MRKICLILVLFLTIPLISSSNFPVFSQNTESITLTTYYPSPVGVYRELRAQRQAIGDTYYDASQYCWPPDTCTNAIDANADLIVEGNVGIGTTHPSMPLVVDGGVLESDGIYRNRLYLSQTSTNGRGGAELDLHNRDSDGRWVGGNLFLANFDYKTGNYVDNELDFLLVKEASAGDWAAGVPGNYLNVLRLLQDGNTILGMLGAGRVGIGVNNPQAKLDVAGEVKIGNTSLACDANTAGAMRYYSGTMQYCDGSGTWKGIGGKASGQNCVWRIVKNPVDHIQCNMGEFMAGIQYESPTWNNQLDYHSWPEAGKILCCQFSTAAPTAYPAPSKQYDIPAGAPPYQWPSETSFSVE